jgi:hypothetical protein
MWCNNSQLLVKTSPLKIHWAVKRHALYCAIPRFGAPCTDALKNLLSGLQALYSCVDCDLSFKARLEHITVSKARKPRTMLRWGAA